MYQFWIFCSKKYQFGINLLKIYQFGVYRDIKLLSSERVLLKSVDKIPFEIWIDVKIDKECVRSFAESRIGNVIDEKNQNTKTRDIRVHPCKSVLKHIEQLVFID